MGCRPGSAGYATFAVRNRVGREVIARGGDYALTRKIYYHQRRSGGDARLRRTLYQNIHHLFSGWNTMEEKTETGLAGSQAILKAVRNFTLRRFLGRMLVNAARWWEWSPLMFYFKLAIDLPHRPLLLQLIEVWFFFTKGFKKASRDAVSQKESELVNIAREVFIPFEWLNDKLSREKITSNSA